MKTQISLLIVLLVLQLGLIFFTNSNQQELGAFVADKPLLDFQPAEIDTITITGPKKLSLILKKVDSGWTIPETFDAPADKAAVKRLLDKLAELKQGLPVATTKEAADRFKVGKDTFERNIVLNAGTVKKAELLVGTSPMFRQVYVRLPENDAVFSVKFSVNDAGVRPEDWLDKTMLTFDVDDLSEINIGSLHLVRKEGKLVPNDPAPGETVDEEAIDRLVGGLAAMRIETVLGNSDKPEYGLETPKLVCSFTLTSGLKQTWRFGRPENKQYYVLKSSDSELFFKVADYQLKPLLDADINALVRPTGTTAANTAAPEKKKEREKPESGE